MLRSVQRLERRSGFRPRLFETRRNYLEFQAIARIQGTEVQAPTPIIKDVVQAAHERLAGLLRRAVHRPEEGPE
jgi:hypothetical protein